MVFEIAKEWYLYHQKYMNEKQRQLLERMFIPMYPQFKFKEKSLKEIVLGNTNANLTMTKTKRGKSKIIFDMCFSSTYLW